MTTEITTGTNSTTVHEWIESCPCCGDPCRVGLCSDECPEPIAVCHRCTVERHRGETDLEAAQLGCTLGLFIPRTELPDDFEQEWYAERAARATEEQPDA